MPLPLVSIRPLYACPICTLEWILKRTLELDLTESTLLPHCLDIFSSFSLVARCFLPRRFYWSFGLRPSVDGQLYSYLFTMCTPPAQDMFDLWVIVIVVLIPSGDVNEII